MLSSLRFLEKLEASDHGIFFYRTPEKKRRVLFNFLKAGLDRDEGAVYVAGDEAPRMIRKAMLNFGLDVKGLEREGLLKIVNYDGWYLVDGKVEISNITALWKKAYEESLERGLKGLHVCGEMGCFFRHNLVEELVEYERALGRRLKISMAALCSYSLDCIGLLKGNSFYDLIKSHGHVVSPGFAGTVKFESLYPSVVREELKALFGKTATKTILLFLKLRYSISEAELVDKPEDFFTALRSIFGSAADLIEKWILQRLYTKLGLK
ncbi:MAG: MEDS domain-containing protein [Candidatus Bathyarchaeia archaeon]